MYDISKEFLIEELIVKKKTITGLARELGVCKVIIHRRIKEYDIPVNIKTRTKDLTGERFTRLVVKNPEENDKFGKTKWRCICDCGNEVVLNASSLLRGLTESCGCLKREINFKGYKDIGASYWNKTKREAKKRCLEFSITIEYAWELFVKQNGKCALSGIDIFLHPNNEKPENRTASIDRIDSRIGYIEGNIQWVHKCINMMKLDLPDEEFTFWCVNVAANSGHIACDISEIDLTRSLRLRRRRDENCQENIPQSKF